MRVILRLKHGPAVRKKRRKNQLAALAASAVITPVALMACALALWRIAADMSLAGAFPFTQGFLSHWQIWFLVAVLLQAFSLTLARYGNARAEALPPPVSANREPPVHQRR